MNEMILFEILVVCYLLYCLYQRPNIIITSFIFIALFIHSMKILNIDSLPTAKSFQGRIMTLAIASFFSYHSIKSTNVYIINMGFFVIFSKILDLFSTKNSIFEEVLTLLLSLICTYLKHKI